MYDLTLAKADRKAIDWIGHRYRHGEELYRLLWGESSQTPDDVDWDGDGDITFTIPEHVAATIREIVDEGLDCFAPDLQQKLRDQVV